MAAKILIVDDEDVLRMLLMDTLEFEGFEVEEAEDGLEGLQKIQETDYDLVLLDYMMPHLTGMELLEKLQPLELDVPIVMLTAKAQQADQEAALSKGAYGFMPKPFSPAELVSLVKEILTKTKK